MPIDLQPFVPSLALENSSRATMYFIDIIIKFPIYSGIKISLRP
jgi:hypothetical protein